MSRSCLCLSAFVVFVASCTSAPPVAPPRPLGYIGASGTPVREFAARHGFQTTWDAGDNRLLLEGGGHRVLLFPGTTVTVVDGTILPGTSRLTGKTGRWTLATSDARKVEAALAESRPVAPIPLADVHPPSEHPATPHPTRGSAGADGDAAWRVPLKREWRYIIIHHSGTDAGNAATFGRFHKRERGWDGLGYDFVIGNGHGSGDGQVEVGYRWAQQLTGAHAGRAADGSNLMNERGIGICLVGNFDKSRPTAAQKRALHRLIGFLESYCRIPPKNVFEHGDIRDTDCPGRLFPVSEFLLRNRAVPRDWR